MKRSDGRAPGFLSACGIVALAASAVALALPQPSLAHAAFAAGVPDNVAAEGVAFGEVHNYSDDAGAEAAALQQCRTSKGAAPSTNRLCKIFEDFNNRCLSISIDPGSGTPGWGWAVADTAALANDQSLAMCRNISSPARAPYCIVFHSACDGTAASAK